MTSSLNGIQDTLIDYLVRPNDCLTTNKLASVLQEIIETNTMIKTSLKIRIQILSKEDMTNIVSS